LDRVAVINTAELWKQIWRVGRLDWIMFGILIVNNAQSVAIFESVPSYKVVPRQKLFLIHMMSWEEVAKLGHII
jgi:hypothetical protein